MPVMRDGARNAFKRAAAKLGYVVHRRDQTHEMSRDRAMRLRGVDLVLDVGANRGQYATGLRMCGYQGRIVSFEPIPAAYQDLVRAHGPDAQWTGRQAAVGAAAGSAELNVSASSVLSSILDARTELSNRIPAVEATEKVVVSVVTLDDLWAELVPPQATTMLKIDVQGFEHFVLDGTAAHLDQIVLMEVEMGLQKLYEGGSTIHDLLPRLHQAGFEVISIDSGFVDVATGQVLDIDVLAGRPQP